MEFIDRLEQLLSEKSLTAKELTEKLEIGRTTVNDWKRGKSTPSPKMLIGISRILSCSIDWLLTGKDFEQTQFCIYDVSQVIELEYYPTLNKFLDAGWILIANDVRWYSLGWNRKNGEPQILDEPLTAAEALTHNKPDPYDKVKSVNL